MIAESTSRALALMAKHHSEYIDMVKKVYKSVGDAQAYPEDFVQEMYMKLSRYDNLFDKVIKPDGTVSKGYAFFVLRSLVITHTRKVRVVRPVKAGSLSDLYDVFAENISDDVDEFRLATEKIENRMFSIVEENLDWFDAKLFKTYMETGKSFRTMAEESGLGIQTIYHSIKRCKLLIADKLHEDYLDLINGDLHLI